MALGCHCISADEVKDCCLKAAVCGEPAVADRAPALRHPPEDGGVDVLAQHLVLRPQQHQVRPGAGGGAGDGGCTITPNLLGKRDIFTIKDLVIFRKPLIGGLSV